MRVNIGCPVVRTDGRSLARCTVTWLPNFLGWVDYHFSLAMGLLPRARFRKEKFLCQVHEFEMKTYWRSRGWTWPELKSHKSDSMAFAITYSHFFEMLVTWAWKRNKFIRIGWCVVCPYQLLYDNVNYTCIFTGCQPRATIPSSVWFVINYKIINFLNGQHKNQSLLLVGYKIPESLTSNMKENAVTVTLSFQLLRILWKKATKIPV